MARVRRRTGAVAAVVACCLSACDVNARAAAAHTPRETRDTSAASELDLFRHALPSTDSLRGGATDAASLLRLVVRAAARQDTTTLARLSVTRAEWAWLYYPASRYTRPPYRSPPALQWTLTIAASEKGVGRLLRELGGRRVRVSGTACARVMDEGANRLWRDCVVEYRLDGARQRHRIASALLERGGRLKVLSYANDF